MGIFGNIVNRFKAAPEPSRRNPTGYEVSEYGYNFAYGNPKSSEYLDSLRGWVFSAVSAIADEFASINLRLYETKGEDTAEITEHPVLDLLYKVNNFTTKFDHFWLTCAYLELTGESPWFIEKDGQKNPINLYFLRPDRITPIPDKNKVLSGYKYNAGGNEIITLGLDEVIFLKYPNPANPFRGIGTLEAASRTVDIDNSAEKWNFNFFKNSARPDSILTVKTDNLDKEQLEKLKASIKKNYQGVEKANKLMVLFGDMDLKKFGASQTDMDFTEQQRFTRDKILGIFRVPKPIVAQTDQVNLANATTAQYTFSRWTIKPKMERLVQQLNEFLLPMFKGTEQMFLDYDSPVMEDDTALLARYDNGIKNGWLTINEVRDLENLEPIEGFDVPFLPLNLVPTGTAPTKAKRIFNFDRKNQLHSRNKEYFESKKYRNEIKSKVKSAILAELEKKGRNHVKSDVLSEDNTPKNQLSLEKRKQFWEVKNKYYQKYLPKVREAQKKVFESQQKRVLAELNKQKDVKFINESILPKKVKKTDINTSKLLLDVKVETKLEMELVLPVLTDLFKSSAKETFDFLGVNMTIDVEKPSIAKLLQLGIRTLSKSATETTNSKIESAVTEGIANDEGIADISKRIQNVFTEATTTRADLISRTETARYNANANEQAFIESGVVEAKQWVTDGNPCPQCIELEGKIVGLGETYFDKGDTATGADGSELPIEYLDVGNPPLHPNSVWDGSSIVFTPSGNKRILDIRTGDLVLTHTGKFKKVLATPRLEKTGKKYKIFVKGKNISLTDEHRVLTISGWKRADELTLDDSVQLTFDICKCGKEKKVNDLSCSKFCQYRNSLLTEAMHETLRKKGHYKRDNTYLKDDRNPAKSEASRKKISIKLSGDSNPMKRPDVAKKAGIAISKAFLAHPEKHPNSIMSQKGFVSSLEKKMKVILDEMNIKYTHQYPIKQYFVDFALNGHKIAIECDGKYWHSTNEAKIRDSVRQKEIECEGWTFLRFSEFNDVDMIKTQITNILKNHTGEFKNVFYQIEKINTSMVKRQKMTYDLTIKDDESFVLNGVSVHNCECDIAPVFIQS